MKPFAGGIEAVAADDDVSRRCERNLSGLSGLSGGAGGAAGAASSGARSSSELPGTHHVQLQLPGDGGALQREELAA